MSNDPRTPDDMNSESVDWDVVARQDPGFAKLIDGAVAGIRASDAATIDTEAALRSVKARAAAPRVLKLERKPRVNWRMLVPAIAAGALLAIGTSRYHEYDGQMKAGTGIHSISPIELPDGSMVTVGPLSSIWVPGNYKSGNRTVVLTGQAFFDVKHDERHPFTVKSNGATIKDIGTKFSVNSHDSTSVTVAVIEGSVQLATSHRSSVVLKQGDRGHAKGGSAPLVEKGTVTADDIAWTKYTLVFRDTPLNEVREQLLRWYGIRLAVGDQEFESRHLTATFTNESPAKVLEVIGFALGADIERKGDTAFVSRSKRTTK